MKQSLKIMQCRPGLYPFWFWNDRLTAKEIRRQVGLMAQQGIRGFYIHPRQGLQQPYLSEAFFEMVDVALKAARAKNLSVHVCDEYPYPSGAAGGEVTLGEPAFHQTRLVNESYDYDGGHVRLELPRGKLLSVKAYPLKNGGINWRRGIDLKPFTGIVQVTDTCDEVGLSAYNTKRYFSGEPTPVLETDLPKGKYRIFASVQTEFRRHKYFDHFVDALNGKAVRRFLELTHERYLRRYGKKLGNSILSFFVDEVGAEWSALVPPAFKTAYGYDLLDVMPALTEPDHPDNLKVSGDLYRLKYKMFCESFEKQVCGWCHAHDLAYVGEKPSLRLAQLRFMDVPGCDAGHLKAGDGIDWLDADIRKNAKAAASAAYFYEKAGALCECYHSLGWGATLQDAKFIADGLMLAGIKYLVPHAFFYSTHGLRKHDAPPSFFFQMPYWPLVNKFSRHIERVNELFAGTYVSAEILVLEPHSGLPTEQDLKTYSAIQKRLMENHLDFLLVDTDILQKSRIMGAAICARDIKARLLIVPPMRKIEKPLAAWLARFASRGGRGIYCQADTDLDRLFVEISKTVQPNLRIKAAGAEAGSVHMVTRSDGKRKLWFLLNTGAETIEARFDTQGPIHEIPLGDKLPALLRTESDKYCRTIRPFESLMLAQDPAPKKSRLLPVIQVPIGGKAMIRLHNTNLLRLYHWQLSLLDQQGNPYQTEIVSTAPILNQLEKGQFRLTPKVEHSFGHVSEWTLGELCVVYACDFESNYAGPIELVMEPGSIGGEWRIFINDSKPVTIADFVPSGAHVKGSLGVDITGLCRRGNNKIRVELKADRVDHGLLSALYLAGDFGVQLGPDRLVNRKAEGDFEAYEANLLPYYAGIIEYRMLFDLEQLPSAPKVILELLPGITFHEASEVSVNGSPFQSVCWQPRCLVLPADRLRMGRNEIVIRVYTTLLRPFEGQRFEHSKHRTRSLS